MEDNYIAAIHERVYVHLTEKYPDVRFHLDASKAGQEDLNRGWWFGGSKNGFEIWFWGNDPHVRLYHIAFVILENGNTSVELHSRNIARKHHTKKIVAFFNNLGEVMAMVYGGH